MSKIKRLSDHLSNQIAAGEVITEPLSVVKELVDNAIDASSTEIEVEIKGSGIKSIMVADNGDGIESDDIDLLFERHATSKIASEDELNNINTLGFRGEALASIVSVSKVSVKTKTKDALQGISVRKYGKNLLAKDHIPCNKGTTVVVEDLFFNTPARFSFLKRNYILQKRITDYVSAVAVCHSNIKFKYVVDDNVVFTTHGNGDELSTIYDVYGKEFISHLRKIEIKGNGFVIKGYVSSLNYSRNNKSLQLTFINDRYTSNKEMNKMVDLAYESLLPLRRFPAVILWVYTDAKNLDINVHPQKLEVKFKNEVLDSKNLSKELRSALYNKKILPKKVIKEEPKDDISTTTEEIELDEVIEEININELMKEERLEYDTAVSETEESFDFKDFIEHMNYIGQIFRSYLIYEKNDSIYFLDQHAAHEKILFERFLEDYRNNSIYEQILLAPEILGLSRSEMMAFETFDFDFSKFGIDVEKFSDDKLVIRSVPHLFNIEQTKAFITTMIDESEYRLSDVTEEAIISRSCKNAIKAMHTLREVEAYKMLEMLAELDNPFTCPHGRPILFEYEKKEIEKKFERL